MMGMKRKNTLRRQTWRWLAVWGLMVFGVSSCLVSPPGPAQADPIPLSVMAGLQTGTITAIHQQTISISGKEYGLDAEVELRDQEDNHLELSAIRPNLEVRFHVKKSESAKIDVMIVFMPQ